MIDTPLTVPRIEMYSFIASHPDSSFLTISTLLAGFRENMCVSNFQFQLGYLYEHLIHKVIHNYFDGRNVGIK